MNTTVIHVGSALVQSFATDAAKLKFLVVHIPPDDDDFEVIAAFADEGEARRYAGKNPNWLFVAVLP